MENEIIYSLDANVFIEAKNRYYAFDIAPPFWDNLVKYAELNRIVSIDRIKKQIEDGKDELAEWIKAGNMKEAFHSTNQDDVIKSYGETMNWIQENPQFTDSAKATFANDPDGWLIAFAKAKNYIVVTQETYKRDARSRIPIPNICIAFDVKFKDTFEMLRELNFKF